MASSTDADANPGEQIIRVWISPTLEADYCRRGVYPHLRIKDAIARSGKHGGFDLSIAEADYLREDAQAQSRVRRSVADKGTTRAYSSLVSRLWGSGIRPTAQQPVQPSASSLGDGALARIEREGRISRVMLDGMKASPARLAPGCRVLLDEDPTDQAEVLEDFGAYFVGNETQPRLGYVVKRFSDGARYFFQPGRLATLDRKPSHLRLV